MRPRNASFAHFAILTDGWMDLAVLLDNLGHQIKLVNATIAEGYPKGAREDRPH
jgi:hypothetical protein